MQQVMSITASMGLVALCLAATGCNQFTNPQTDAGLSDALAAAEAESDRLAAELAALQAEHDQLVEASAAMQTPAVEPAEPEVITVQDPVVLQQMEDAIARQEQLEAALSEAESALRDLDTAPAAMPAALDQALLALAGSSPDLVVYHPETGMIRFKSDLTFNSGSAKLRPEAAASLKRLAVILKGPDAAGYEARIVGHTDSQRIARAETLAKHPSNWHLSVHRAIAVKDVLEEAGINADRLGVAGYGPHRPLVKGKSKAAEEANRRVEVFITPRHESPKVIETPQEEPLAAGEVETAVASTPDQPGRPAAVSFSEAPVSADYNK